MIDQCFRALLQTIAFDRPLRFPKVTAKPHRFSNVKRLQNNHILRKYFYLTLFFTSTQIVH